MSTKPSERIAELCEGNNVGAWCFAICAYLDEQHAASLPPVEKASVPEPGYCACSVTVVARTPGGATYCKICGRGTRVDPPAAPPPPVYEGPPEPLPATIRDARCVSSGRSCPVAALGGRAGSEEQVYWGNWSNPNRRTWVAVNEIDWRHYRNFQVPAAPPAVERVEGMAEERFPRKFAAHVSELLGSGDETGAMAMYHHASEQPGVYAAINHRDCTWEEQPETTRAWLVAAYRFARAEGYEQRKAEETSARALLELDLATAREQIAEMEGYEARKAEEPRFTNDIDWKAEALENLTETGLEPTDKLRDLLAVCMEQSWIDGQHWGLEHGKRATGGAKGTP